MLRIARQVEVSVIGEVHRRRGRGRGIVFNAQRIVFAQAIRHAERSVAPGYPSSPAGLT